MSNTPIQLYTPDRKRAILAICLAIPYFLYFPRLLAQFGLDSYTTDLIYYPSGTLLFGALFFSFLRDSLALLKKLPQRTVGTMFLAMFGAYAGEIAVALVLGQFGLFQETANNEAVHSAMLRHPAFSVFSSVVLAPITEELIFRGAIFTRVREKNRYAAYAIAAIAFALAHTYSAIVGGDFAEALRGLVYVPSSIALCFVYERTGTIWMSVFLHMVFNTIASTNLFFG